MASIFEKTMKACRESKANATKKSNAASKRLAEKYVSKRIKKESDEEDDFDDEVMMDVQDDIVAVIDPDLDADEMTSVAQGFQQLVDDAGANEIPETDEYIDNEIYGCPVCGAKFFSEDPMTGGGVCPVCGKEADGFVLVGEVDESEDSESDEDKDKDKGSDEDEVSGKFDVDGEEIDVEVTGDPESEGKKASKKETRKPIRRAVRREGAKVRRPVRRSVRGERRIARRPGMRSESLRTRGLNLDEKTFNKYLTKFVRENYNNVTSFTVRNAKLNKNNLTLECSLKFKSGKAKKVNLECRYNRASKFMMAKDKGAFKTESKKSAPFMFQVRTVGNVIRCEGMKYNFVTTTKIKNESKKIRVHGSYMNESKRVVRRPMARRAMESRRVTRRASARRVAESRRAIRRPVARRVSESRRVVRRPATRRSRLEATRRITRRPMTRRVGESRRVIRRPVTSRATESRRIAARRSVRSMRAEASRIRRPATRKSMVRSERLRRSSVVRKPGMRSESRIARRNAIARRTRR